MKRTLASAALAAFLLSSPLTQAQSDRRAMIEQRLQETAEVLDLSDAQRQEIEPVLLASMESQQSILSSYGIDPANPDGAARKLGFRKLRAMQRELEAVRAQTRSDLSGILSEQQLAAFERLQAERKAEMRERIRAQR